MKEKQEVLRGKVVGVKGAQGIVLEVPPLGGGREEQPPTREIRFTDKTIVMYQGAGPGGAKPTEGYFAQVWLEEGAKDAADRVMMGATVAGRRWRQGTHGGKL